MFWLDGHFSGSRFETAKAELDTPICKFSVLRPHLRECHESPLARQRISCTCRPQFLPEVHAVIELDAVMKDATDNDVILIDDARLFRGYGNCGGDFRSECYP